MGCIWTPDSGVLDQAYTRFCTLNKLEPREMALTLHHYQITVCKHLILMSLFNHMELLPCTYLE